MLIISQNDNSKELKLETNFNVLQYDNIPIGARFSYNRKLYIKISMED